MAKHVSGGRTSSVIARFIATAGGAGYIPFAPGTAGTLVAVPIAWWLRATETSTYLAIVAIVILAGIPAATRADRYWKTHDSGRIVIDEVAGYLVTVAFIDRSSAWMLWIAFAVFRILDSVKPPPIRWFEDNLPGGTGVVLDDVVAGMIGAVIMVVVEAAGR